jgi:hypothetical protein
MGSPCVLVHREMEFRPIGVTDLCTASSPGSRGIVPRRLVALVPIPEPLSGSGPGRPGGLLPQGSHGSVRALSGIRLVTS